MDFKEFMAAKYPDIEPSGIVYLAIKAAWNACKEEAAKVAEDMFVNQYAVQDDPDGRREVEAGEDIAKAIREL